MIGPLPASDDKKFWLDADMHKVKPKHNNCRHEFVRLNSREVECKFCHAGYVLDKRSILKNGRIYINNKLAI